MTQNLVVLQRAELSVGAAGLLERAIYHPEVVSVETYALWVKNGEAACFEVFSADGLDLVGALLVRFERIESGSEMVIFAAAGRCPGVDLMSSVLPSMESLAWRIGCSGVRVHTCRPGMVERLQRAGFVERERVFVRGCRAAGGVQ